jgi:hypothetical protein
MTVKELQDYLKNYDDDMEVFMDPFDTELTEVRGVSEYDGKVIIYD